MVVCQVPKNGIARYCTEVLAPASASSILVFCMPPTPTTPIAVRTQAQPDKMQDDMDRPVAFHDKPISNANSSTVTLKAIDLSPDPQASLSDYNNLTVCCNHCPEPEFTPNIIWFSSPCRPGCIRASPYLHLSHSSVDRLH